MNSCYKYITPHPLKAKLLAWSELNINEVDLLTSLFQNNSNNDINSYLEKIFELNANARPRDKILLDLHFYAFKFAFANSFSKIQISSFISILRAIHRANQETPFDNYDLILNYFRDLILCHSIKRPPFCVAIFDQSKVVQIVNYINDTYLRHYKLYKYSFTPITGVNLKFNYLNMPNNELPERNNDLNSQSLIAELSDKSLQTISESSGKTLTQTNESPAKQEMRNYIRQLLQEELDSQEIREKLSILSLSKLDIQADEDNINDE